MFFILSTYHKRELQTPKELSLPPLLRRPEIATTITLQGLGTSGNGVTTTSLLFIKELLGSIGKNKRVLFIDGKLSGHVNLCIKGLPKYDIPSITTLAKYLKTKNEFSGDDLEKCTITPYSKTPNFKILLGGDTAFPYEFYEKVYKSAKQQFDYIFIETSSTLDNGSAISALKESDHVWFFSNFSNLDLYEFYKQKREIYLRYPELLVKTKAIFIDTKRLIHIDDAEQFLNAMGIDVITCVPFLNTIKRRDILKSKTNFNYYRSLLPLFSELKIKRNSRFWFLQLFNRKEENDHMFKNPKGKKNIEQPQELSRAKTFNFSAYLSELKGAANEGSKQEESKGGLTNIIAQSDTTTTLVDEIEEELTPFQQTETTTEIEFTQEVMEALEDFTNSQIESATDKKIIPTYEVETVQNPENVEIPTYEEELLQQPEEIESIEEVEPEIPSYEEELSQEQLNNEVENIEQIEVETSTYEEELIQELVEIIDGTVPNDIVNATEEVENTPLHSELPNVSERELSEELKSTPDDNDALVQELDVFVETETKEVQLNGELHQEMVEEESTVEKEDYSTGINDGLLIEEDNEDQFHDDNIFTASDIAVITENDNETEKIFVSVEEQLPMTFERLLPIEGKGLSPIEKKVESLPMTFERLLPIGEKKPKCNTDDQQDDFSFSRLFKY